MNLASNRLFEVGIYDYAEVIEFSERFYKHSNGEIIP